MHGGTDLTVEAADNFDVAESGEFFGRVVEDIELCVSGVDRAKLRVEAAHGDEFVQ